MPEDLKRPPAPSSAEALSPSRRLLVVGAFLVFLALLSWRLGEREFWVDEQISVGHIREPGAIFDAFHPPGYYFLLRQWAEVWGRTDLALRAFSLPWAILSLALTWLLARALLPSRAAVLGLWLFALSPLALLYLRMARYFSITLACALLVAWFALLVYRHGRPRYYLGLALSAAGVLWLHYVPSLLLPLVYLWVLPRAWQRGRERWWWALAALLPLALYLPEFARLGHDVSRVAATSEAVEVGLRGVLLRLMFPLYAALLGETTAFWRLGVVVPVALAGSGLWVVGALAAWRRGGGERYLLVLAWPLAVLVVTILLCTVAASEPWPRGGSLSLFALPFFYLVLALGVVRLGPRWGMLLFAVFLAGQLYGTGNYLLRREFLNPGYNVPWREANDLVQSLGEPGDVAVAFFDSAVQRYWQGPVRFLDYYASVPGAIDPLEEALAAALPAGQSVWVIYRDRGSRLARDMTREMISRLAAVTEQHERYEIYPLPPAERRWRERLQGHPVEPAYLTIYRFRDARPSSTPPPAPRLGDGDPAP